MAKVSARARSTSRPALLAAILAGALVTTTAPPALGYPLPGGTERVSVATDGTEGDAASSYGGKSLEISANGRFVVFYSGASTLVPDDTNGFFDVFVHDRFTRQTERVSVASDGTEGNEHSPPINGGFTPSISADGRYVAFYSRASNLVPGDTNGVLDVFVHDRETHETERVSVASDGTEGNDISAYSSISGDGRYVAFWSNATTFALGDTNGLQDVFVHDRVTRETIRASVATDGTGGNSASTGPAMSPDGRYVAYSSLSSNLVPGDANGSFDVFVHDLETRETERISVSSRGTEGNGTGSYLPALSTDGRYIAFYSFASNLVHGDTNRNYDVFVHDRVTHQTERVSLSNAGVQGNGFNWAATISGDGRYVGYYSNATTLAPGDANNTYDVFVYDRITSQTDRVSVATDGGDPNGYAAAPSLSADGRYVAYYSDASNLVPGDTNGVDDVFVRDRGPSFGAGALSAVRQGDSVSVSGWARFPGTPLSSASDPATDAAAGAEEAGGELTGASVTYRPEIGDVLFKLSVTSLPGERCTQALCETGGGVPGVLAPGVLYRRLLYGVAFRRDGISYEVRLRTGSSFRASSVNEADDPHHVLYRCDPTCTEVSTLNAGIGAAGGQIWVSVPTSAIELSEGNALTNIRASTSREADASDPAETLDTVDLSDAVIPTSQVMLGIAPAATPADDVVFGVVADRAESAFSGSLDASSLPDGEHRAWVRVCAGEVCGTTSTPITG